MINRPTRFYSRAQEKQVAKAVGGKPTANSGATSFVKGDVVVGSDWLLECKTCVESKKSFSIKKEWLEKNKEEAFATNKANSALVFNFGPNEPNYYIIDEKTFKQVMNILKEDESYG